MPDQPDDARKRQQRGVFPPFFAPRKNGRGDSTPTPPSGSWRRVSRLFTPPEVTRQRRTPAAQQTAYTPPAPPATGMPEAAAQPASEFLDALDALAQSELGAAEALVPPALPEEPSVDAALPLELEQPAADALAHFDPLAFHEGADSFVVESLEPEPISLASFDVAPIDAAVDSAMDIATGGAALPGGALEEPPVEIDPWEGAELPEPAFGSIGWPSSEIAAPAVEQPVEQSVEGVDEMSAALAWSDAEAEGAAAERASRAHDSQEAQEADEASVSSDDALAAMAHELRDSSSAWVADAIDESADVSARARFYGGGEPSDPFPTDSVASDDADAASEAGGYAAELAAAEAAGAAAHAAGDDAGAAIADALARVAARIRAGEVDLPAEVVGASDESALAAALAALLRGPRR